MIINITIDGPSGSGKSTIAKAISKDLGITYLDTGAMYRGVAYYVISKGIDPSDEKGVLGILDDIKMDIIYKDGEQKIIICNQDVTPYIREHNISMAASTVSKKPAVRLKLVELQRKIASQTDCVIDGRDIGSYVLPNAKYKFYMTASAEERAKRRHKELLEKGKDIGYEEVLEDIKKRDIQDSTRAFAPLVVPEGAVVVDTTNMTIDQVLKYIKERIC
ncbi:MAG: (d)CMP kinase [Bacillota bacterium]|jgi:cytidylate kinase|nr:(d)CMP kinase [Bacillota bacterium]HHU42869.1 (d)CMP kinase [Clostridiales bacterium]